jgi:DNA-binding NtrC family response regulator
VPPVPGETASSKRLARVLISSDDHDLNAALARLLAEHGAALSADSRASVLSDVCAREGLRLLILGETGTDFVTLDLLQAIKEQRPDVAVLIVSAHPTVEHAAESIRRGAEDFVPVPYSDEIVRKEVGRILEAAELRDRVATLDRLIATRYGFERIISRSTRMRAVFDRATAASQSDVPVLIIGETGTGKELIARAIHANGRRSHRPFVPINCAALPRDLVESELFGHRRGAFSGAFTDHAGLFAAANGGSLFLDEVGELPLDVQAKLLRVLQDGEVRAVGGLESRRVDARVVAASNRSLAEMRDKGMRQDLFFRLSVLVIEIPPLRERREDLPLLVAHFLNTRQERNGHHAAQIDPQALDLLAEYHFPGNVRELENMIEGLSVAMPADRTTIRADDVRDWLRRRGLSMERRPIDAPHVPLKLDELEAWAIGEALRQTRGNKSAAAMILGISRDTLYRKLHGLGLDSELSDSRTPSDSRTSRPNS